MHDVRNLLIGLVISTMLAAGVLGQDAPALTGAREAAPEISQLESRIAEIEGRSDLDAATKSAITDQLRAAITSLQTATDMRARAAESRRLASEAPALLESIRAELAQPPAEAPTDPGPELTLQQAEQTHDQTSADLQAARQLLAEIQQEATRRSQRRTEIPDRVARLRQDLANLNDTLGAPPDPTSAPDGLALARRDAQLAQRAALEAEIDAIEAEAASYDARRDLLPARRDRANRRVSELEKHAAAWQEIVKKRREGEARRSAAEAQRLSRGVAQQDPVLEAFAEATENRASERAGPNGLPKRINGVSQAIASLQTEIAALNEQLRSIRRRIDASGLNRATGLLLRRQFESLPDVRALNREVSSTQEQLERAEYELIELQDERADYGDIDRIANDLLAQIRARGDAPPDMTELQAAATELVTARRDLLNMLVADAGALFDGLVRQNSLARLRLERAKELESFIEERILWVRNIPGDQIPSIDDLQATASRLLDLEDWRRAAGSIRRFAARSWPSVVAVVAGVIALFVGAPIWRRRIRHRGEQVSKFPTDSLLHSFDALLFTFIVALRVPILLYAIGWLFVSPTDQSQMVLAFGTGLQSAGKFVLALSFLRVALRPHGLATAHFRWPDATTKAIRRHLRWFIPLAIPLVTIIAATEALSPEAASASLGRIAFTIELLAIGFVAQRLLRPSGPVLKPFLTRRKDGWIDRLRLVWFPAALLLPVALIVVAWMGFYYTALEITQRIEWTLVFILVLVVINQVLKRWLFIARRNIAIENAKRRRAQQAEAAASSASDTKSTGEIAKALPIDEGELDLPAVSEQTRQLFRAVTFVSLIVGLLVIWSEILPALRMLERVQVLPSIRVVDSDERTGASLVPNTSTVSNLGTSDTSSVPSPQATPAPTSSSSPVVPDGSSSTSSEAESEPLSLTLSDLGMALLIVVITWIAFRNLPGLIEIVVLQRLPLDAGSRYALSTTLRYAIALVGLSIAFNALGISWSKVQWLAAALTFGLAFGLQEIFANFVSGLIILGERPVRVGDTVTVGTVSGTVSRIRMRATTITDWDRKELIIPNKNFITGEVINWSLADPILRVTIKVGIAYGSETQKAEELLYRAADENDRVVDDPAPNVVFSAFGESSLDFELRVHIPSIDHFIKVRHELHSAIDRLFREAGIEIAFPQRDLHLRSISESVELPAKKDV